MEYPEYKGNFAKVIVTTKSGNKCKAMFYWNGNKPTFATYGSDITENVVSWEYATPTEKGGKE